MSATTFTWHAVGADGQRRSGQLRAAGEQEVFRTLSAQGMTPVKISEHTARSPMLSGGRITQQDVTGLTRELSVLLESNIPLAQGLRAIAEHETKASLRSVVLDIAGMIESGASISAAMEKHRGLLGDVYVETMRAAEKSGSIATITASLAEMLERQLESRQQLRRALTYPVIVLTMVTLAVSVIVVYVIPRFGATFAAQGVEMPLITKVLQAVGESVHELWWVYGTLGVSAAFAALAAWRAPGGRLGFERAMSRIPYMGRILKSVTAARFSRVFGIGLGSGLDLIESLEMSGRATGRPLFARECELMGDRLRRGEALGDVLHDNQTLPAFARRMLSAGKDAHELSRACEIVARHYDRESEHLTKNVNTAIEPLLTVAMAVIVLIVALSVFLPMWQMVGINR